MFDDVRQRPLADLLFSRKLLSMMAKGCLATCLLGTTALAQDVVIVSRDGQSRVVGKLLDADAETLTIETAIGAMTFQSDHVICEGETCPVADLPEVPEVPEVAGLPEVPEVAGLPEVAEVAEVDEDGDDDGDDVADAFAYTLRMSASAGIADQLLPVLAEGLAIGQFGANAKALDAAGMPLPEDIGRPLPGGAREDHNDADGDDGQRDLISIVFHENDSEKVEHAYAVYIEEDEDAAESLAEGDVEVMFLHEPPENEWVELVAAGGGGNIRSPAQERVIGVEGVTVAVSPDNPIGRLRIDQVARIFSGEISNWSQVGGADAPINVYSFDNANAAFHYIEDLVLEPADKKLSETAVIVQTMRELTSKILSDPNGIGVTPFTSQRGTRAVPIESECGIVTAPSPFAIKNEEYLLNRRFYAYSRETVSDEARTFLDFLKDPTTDQLVQKAGFIDLSVIEQNQMESGERMEALIRVT